MEMVQKTVDENWADVQPRKGFFDAFRDGQFPPLYPEQHTPADWDVLEAGFYFAGAIIAFSLLLLMPGIHRGDRFSSLVRVFVGVFILTTILVVNFGQEWEVAQITSKTQYRAGLRNDINASIGVRIGLRSINITLKGLPEVQTFNENQINETINYNERISWDNLGWLVGRGGFGPYAGRFNQEFKAHQRKGTPYPILWIAEYFTLDGEGVRWGRFYLQAGYYTHVVLWSALPLWFLSLILFKVVVRYGAYFSLLTGLFLLAGNAIYANIRNPYELIIPFENDNLVFKWGHHFWLCVFTGLLCCVIGIVVIVMECFCQEYLAEFFGVDMMLNLDEYYIDKKDEETGVARNPKSTRITMKNAAFARGAADKSAPAGVMVHSGPTRARFADTNIDPPQEMSNSEEQPQEQTEIQTEVQTEETPSRTNSTHSSSGISSVASECSGSQRSQISEESMQRGYTRRAHFPSAMKCHKQKPRPGADRHMSDDDTSPV